MAKKKTTRTTRKKPTRKRTKKSAAKKNASLKIFISYSHHDKESVDKIASRLKEEGHVVWIDSLQLKLGDNISERISDGISQADAIIFATSSESLNSKWMQVEFSAIAIQQISKRQQRIIPVRLDNCEIPSYLADKLFLDLSDDFERGLDRLVQTLRVESADAFETSLPKASIEDSRERHIERLAKCLQAGKLTLFCGAGVSVGAGIPAWNQLLSKLLDAMLERISRDHSLDLGKWAAQEFQERNSSSSLILGKYLKNNLGNDFAREVRDALYPDSLQNCDLIDSIVDLARPQRDSRPLDSIVTFNFDCLIEDYLTKARIPRKAIYSESIAHNQDEIPIYHVHGYLPRNSPIPEQTELVFSEDAYHSQFIDPFSWSNLIQLNKFTQTTCFFVGISLTDPNMRRLLDVAWRKNPDKRLRHYIAKRLPKSSSGRDVIDDVTRLLEEQDANALGLNVIWFHDYDELPSIVSHIPQINAG